LALRYAAQLCMNEREKLIERRSIAITPLIEELSYLFSLALAVFSFYTSLAGQPLVRGAIPDD